VLTILGVITFFVYTAIMSWLSLNASREEMLTNKLVMQRIVFFGPLIFVGLWAATLSSALASLLAAPRTLQALGQALVSFANGFEARNGQVFLPHIVTGGWQKLVPL